MTDPQRQQPEPEPDPGPGPERNPELDNLIWLQETCERRLAEARREI
ncbi:hypothetical protein [Streptomyces californicus]